MPLPPTAFVITAPMDPADIADFVVTITKEGDPLPAGERPFLLAGEEVESYTLMPSPEAVAAGVVIKSGGGYDTTLADDKLRFWLEVDPAEQGNAIFDAPGLTLGLEFTALTTSSPQRRKQRTVGIKVANQ